jgi:hypothetical protein
LTNLAALGFFSAAGAFVTRGFSSSAAALAARDFFGAASAFGAFGVLVVTSAFVLAVFFTVGTSASFLPLARAVPFFSIARQR